jgi:succinyl-diaminopimelate desuccinylase
MAGYSAAVELTRALIRQNTVNPPGNETRCNAILRPLLETAGFEVLEHAFGEGRSNLIARIEGADKSRLPIAFTGHVDTVPLGTKKWNWDPFKAEIVEDRLYGRGSSDMKSGVAAFVDACISRRDELARGPGVLLIITAAEETGCEGAFALTCDSSVLGVAGALIVAEPTANYPFVGHKGAIWLRAVAEGVTAHGSMPEKGVNAVMKAARAAVRLDDFDFNQKRHNVLGGPTLNVGTFHGGLNVNSVPDRAELGLDVRTVPGQTNASVTAGIANVLGNDITVSPVLDVDPIWTEPEHPWVQQVFAILEPILGERLEVRGAPYFTDGAALKPALGNPPTIILGPGEAHMAHQTDEYCLISRIDQAVKAYIQIIDAWCRGHQR